jgi:hypothetical protein
MCATVTEPIAFVQSDGRIVKSCMNPNVKEWKSLALVGRLALTDKHNKMAKNYQKDFVSEKDIGLKLFDAKHPEKAQ